MSAPLTKDQLAFQLPYLTYVDAHYEEPNLRFVPEVEPQHSVGAWLAGRIVAFRTWREKRAALTEMEMMTDRELMDIGLSRADLRRVFDPAHNADLVARSGG
jgi:uncharacterized protein YjiS (DUF1127 family)